MTTSAIAIVLAALGAVGVFALRNGARKRKSTDEMLNNLERAHFRYFVDNQDPNTGLISDNNSGKSPASIAAVGFGLSAYEAAVLRGWISREDAAAWTLRVLLTLSNTPKGPEADGVSGYRGFFYHFLDPKTGLRARAPVYWDSELSSIDTALLIAGVESARVFYDGATPAEAEIRNLAKQLYEAVVWDWMAKEDGTVSLAWSPENGMHPQSYRGYNEALLLYIIAYGSPEHSLPPSAMAAVQKEAFVRTDYGQTYIAMHGNPLFPYQYPMAWVDFRGIFDAMTRKLGFDYFENARRMTVVQHAYAVENPMGWKDYGDLVWSLTACNGAGVFKRVVNGQEREFAAYRERGAPNGFDDGTVAPTAAASSIVYEPELVIRTLKFWLANYPRIWTPQGFADSFNPTLDPSQKGGWVSPVSIGIDQGPIVMMIENYRSGLFWSLMRRSDYIRTGLRRAGFTGGWLETSK